MFYALPPYVATLRIHPVAIRLAEFGAAQQNGFAERLMCILWEVGISDYQDYHDVYGQTDRFLDGVCMRRRIHA